MNENWYEDKNWNLNTTNIEQSDRIPKIISYKIPYKFMKFLK